ncbi:MAG TPA: hypothetical protein HA343_02950 [Methanomassiliicoccales archaeon]|nr:hypothetical protein [Methanomassiliicoccales archaeon]
MASRVKVVTPICSHETWVTAEMDGEDRLKVRIESDCSNVMNYAERLGRVTMDDINEQRGSRILTAAEDGILTPTCLVPIAVMNACWVEAGMISKRLAIKEGPISIHFID